MRDIAKNALMYTCEMQEKESIFGYIKAIQYVVGELKGINCSVSTLNCILTSDLRTCQRILQKLSRDLMVENVILTLFKPASSSQVQQEKPFKIIEFSARPNLDELEASQTKLEDNPENFFCHESEILERLSQRSQLSEGFKRFVRESYRIYQVFKTKYEVIKKLSNTKSHEGLESLEENLSLIEQYFSQLLRPNITYPEQYPEVIGPTFKKILIKAQCMQDMQDVLNQLKQQYIQSVQSNAASEQSRLWSEQSIPFSNMKRWYFKNDRLAFQEITLARTGDKANKDSHWLRYLEDFNTTYEDTLTLLDTLTKQFTALESVYRENHSAFLRQKGAYESLRLLNQYLNPSQSGTSQSRSLNLSTEKAHAKQDIDKFADLMERLGLTAEDIADPSAEEADKRVRRIDKFLTALEPAKDSNLLQSLSQNALSTICESAGSGLSFIEIATALLKKKDLESKQFDQIIWHSNTNMDDEELILIDKYGEEKIEYESINQEFPRIALFLKNCVFLAESGIREHINTQNLNLIMEYGISWCPEKVEEMLRDFEDFGCLNTEVIQALFGNAKSIITILDYYEILNDSGLLNDANKINRVVNFCKYIDEFGPFLGSPDGPYYAAVESLFHKDPGVFDQYIELCENNEPFEAIKNYFDEKMSKSFTQEERGSEDAEETSSTGSSVASAGEL